MDQGTCSLLDLPSVLQMISRLAHSPAGKERALRLHPLRDEEEIERRFRLLDEAVRFAAEKERISFQHLEDPDGVLSELSGPDPRLEPIQFLLLLPYLQLAAGLRQAFPPRQWPLLAVRVQDLGRFEELVRRIEQTFDPSGEIREGADPRLREARKKQTHLRTRLQEHLESYFAGPKGKYLIPDPFVTQRNGRYVLPLRVEHVREIPGIVHGSSSSGATLFLEPLSAVDLNNQYLYFQEREQEIIREILGRLSQDLKARLPELQTLVDRVGELDLLFACAEFFHRFRCTLPELGREQPHLLFEEARHPLLLETLGEAQVVPISLKITRRDNCLVISGPNTGGKTVSLKTVGLFALMAQSGLPLPALRVQLPLFHSILADIGDHQSIAEHLSTFSAHIQRLKWMMETVNPPALILLDELGRGTDPVYGSALAIAVMDFFRRKEVLLVVTTHQQAVKSFAAATEGIRNASVQLDPVTLRPTYRIELGVAGSSSGLEIAEQLGFPVPLLERARACLEEKDLLAERFLARLREELQALEREKEELLQQQEELGARRAEWEAEFQRREVQRQQEYEAALERWSREFQAEWRRLLQRVKDRFEAVRIRREMKARESALKEAFRAKYRSPASPEPCREGARPGDLQEGDWAYHAFFRKEGKVLEIQDQQAIIEIDGKKVNTAIKDLSKSTTRKVVRRPARNVTLHVAEEVNPELNLIGQTVNDALERADKFLDRAFVSHLPEVRIIHGYGSGRLQKALAGFLADHPQVEEFETEGGATRVRIRS